MDYFNLKYSVYLLFSNYLVETHCYASQSCFIVAWFWRRNALRLYDCFIDSLSNI